jgi:hypothetical protein
VVRDPHFWLEADVSEPTNPDKMRDLAADLRAVLDLGLDADAGPHDVSVANIAAAACRRALAAEAELRRLKAPGGDPSRRSMSVEEVLGDD